MEIILEIVFEVILQLGIELIANFGVHSFNREAPGPVVASIGYLIFGALLGAASLLIFQDSFIADSTLKILHLIFTPILLGFVMSFIGQIREKRDKEVVRLEKFAYGFLFAFGVAIVRYVFAG